MALTRTHSAVLSVDSKTLNVKDTTLLSSYVSNIEGITTETSLIDAITEVIITISNDTIGLLSATITSNKEELRSSNGSSLNISSIFGLDLLEDEKYTIAVKITISSVQYTSTTEQVFYSQTKLAITKAVINTQWEESLSYSSLGSSSKYSIKLKSWIDQVIILDSNGLVTEAYEILLSLKSIL